jgi:glyoxylase I family protein
VARTLQPGYAPRVLAFHHIAIQCADLAACERFYREVLGLEVVRRWPGPGGVERSVWLALGDGFMALERADSGLVGSGVGAGGSGARSPEVRSGEARPGIAPARLGQEANPPPGQRAWRDGVPGLHLLALRIAPSERAAWEARFESRGVPVVHRTRWTIYVRDPEGNRIGLSHHPLDAEAIR